MLTSSAPPPPRFMLTTGALAVASLLLWQLLLDSAVPLAELFPLAVAVAAVVGGLRAGSLALAGVMVYVLLMWLPSQPALVTWAEVGGRFASLAGMAYAGAFWHRHSLSQASQVRRANERLAAVIREAPVAVYAVDAATDIVTLWNPAAERLFGWEADEVLGRPFRGAPEDTLPQRRDMQARLREGHSVMGMETQRVHKDGTRRDVTLSVAPLRGEDGSDVEMLAFGEDITERKRTERALHEALTELFAVVNESPAAIYMVDSATDAIKLWNPAAERLFGWASTEIMGQPLPTHPDGRAVVSEGWLERLRAGGSSSDHQVIRIRKDGTPLDVSLSLALVPGTDGGPDAVLVSALDITARKQAERDLHTAMTEVSALINDSPVAVYMVDAETDNVKFWNPAATRLFGWSAEEVVGRPLPVVPRDLMETRRELIEGLLAGTTVTDYEISGVRKDGSQVDVSLSYGLVPRNGRLGDILSFSVDITGRKQAERDLRQSREQYRQLVESATDVVYRADVTGRFTFVNPMAARLTGRSEEELIGLRFSDLVHPDHVRSTSRFYYRQYWGRKPTSHLEFPIQHADGHTIWVEQNVQLVMDSTDRPTGFQAIVRDVSERRAAQEALAEQFAQAEAARAGVRAMLDASIDTMIFVGTDMRVRTVNRAYYTQIAAGAVEDVLGRHIEEFRAGLETQFENGEDLYQMAIRTLSQPAGVETMELRQPPPMSKVFLVSSTPVVTPGGEFTGRLFLLRDVTEERAIERAKDHLVSMVSHELRTPLTAIMGYTELLLTDSDEPPTTRQAKFLNVVMESSNHQLELVNDLLDISQLKEGMVTVRPVPMDLTKTAEAVHRTLLPQAKAKGLTVTAEGPSEGLMVHADPQRVEQVIRNLVSNSIKYTPAGGAVTVRVSLGQGHGLLEVRDTGIGMSAEEQQQVFTRFFRAPAAAHSASGSGLGLAIAKALVELQGGEMGFSSAVGAGSTFWFTLPFAQSTPAVAPEQSPEPVTSTAGPPRRRAGRAPR